MAEWEERCKLYREMLANPQETPMVAAPRMKATKITVDGVSDLLQQLRVDPDSECTRITSQVCCYLFYERKKRR